MKLAKCEIRLNLQVELSFKPEGGGNEQKFTVFDFKNGGGVTLAMYNTDQSIRDFAHSSFQVRTNRRTIEL